MVLLSPFVLCHPAPRWVGCGRGQPSGHLTLRIADCGGCSLGKRRRGLWGGGAASAASEPNSETRPAVRKDAPPLPHSPGPATHLQVPLPAWAASTPDSSLAASSHLTSQEARAQSCCPAGGAAPSSAGRRGNCSCQALWMLHRAGEEEEGQQDRKAGQAQREGKEEGEKSMRRKKRSSEEEKEEGGGRRKGEGKGSGAHRGKTQG